ncbi:hypothetical protein [Haliangium sp.]|uniref:hypothetical protein n=1 Tax=Haliangium sp. TaxID=2663208 RepID=UPI003D10E8A7
MGALLGACAKGGVETPPPTPDAAADVRADAGPVCVPGCADGVLRTCAPETEVPCDLGCNAGGFACRTLVPSNGAVAAQLDGVTASIQVPADGLVLISSDTGLILDGDTNEVRPAGEGVLGGIGFYDGGQGTAVVAVDELIIGRNGFLSAVGSNALIILSAGDVIIEGLVDVSAVACLDDVNQELSRCGGVGGGDGALVSTEDAGGCAAGGNGNGAADPTPGDETGGGGGGLGGNGAPGGTAGDSTAPGAGGDVTAACPGSDLRPLRGGSGGGAGGISNAEGEGGGAGGGGGGALQITSLSRIAVVGSPGQFVQGILASGGGGGAGVFTTGGGGGGSGGGILLEAPAIEITSVVIAANGGGGGGADGPDGDNNGEPDVVGTAGEAGRFDSTQASGGNGIHSGGLGGALAGEATPGAGGGDATGGGGGGAGIIRFNVPAAGLRIEGSTISPAHTRVDPGAE